VRRPMVAISAWASSMVAPGASRPKTKISGPPPRGCADGSGRSGVQKPWLSGKAKPSGITPTTVWTTAPRRTCRPTTPRSPPKRVRHASWPITSTGGEPGRSSSSTRGRPSSGGTRARRKPAAVISATCTSSGGPSPRIRLRPTVWNAPMSRTVRISSRHTTKSWSVCLSSLFTSTSQFSSATIRSPSSSGSRG
jgi:hypothetical protein